MKTATPEAENMLEKLGRRGISSLNLDTDAIRITTEQDPHRCEGVCGDGFSEMANQACEDAYECGCVQFKDKCSRWTLGGKDYVDGDFYLAEVIPPALVFYHEAADWYCPWGALECAMDDAQDAPTTSCREAALEWLALFDRPVYLDGFHFPDFHNAHNAAKAAGLF